MANQIVVRQSNDFEYYSKDEKPGEYKVNEDAIRKAFSEALYYMGEAIEKLELQIPDRIEVGLEIDKWDAHFVLRAFE